MGPCVSRCKIWLNDFSFRNNYLNYQQILKKPLSSVADMAKKSTYCDAEISPEGSKPGSHIRAKPFHRNAPRRREESNSPNQKGAVVCICNKRMLAIWMWPIRRWKWVLCCQTVGCRGRKYDAESTQRAQTSTNAAEFCTTLFSASLLLPWINAQFLSCSCFMFQLDANFIEFIQVICYPCKSENIITHLAGVSWPVKLKLGL